mmetsp:Transcript_27974/g.59056  ORF Transcript_27974/g.59056 Transcript_27974/m.59056 type:complete len:508 (+) Transcript_27974:88-1611(+)
MIFTLMLLKFIALSVLSALSLQSWSVESFRPSLTSSSRALGHHRCQSLQQLRAAASDNTWSSSIIRNQLDDAIIESVKSLCESTPARLPDAASGESGLAFLFVSQRYSDSFEQIVQAAHATLGQDVTLLSIVGGGVIGGGVESDDPTMPAVSLLCGILPVTANVEAFMFGPDEAPPPPSSEAWRAIARGVETPSYVLFADPWSKIDLILNGLDSSGRGGGNSGSAVVAGGISCPTFGEDGSTVGLNGKAYPRGTAVGVGLSGTIGLQAIVAQGCRPIGPIFEVTEADENLIVTLDNRPATEVLHEIAEGDCLSDKEKETVKTYGILCGIAAKDQDPLKGDYLVRQIMGFRMPAVMIGAQVKVGDVLRFHVRDSMAALEDMQNMISRTKTERMFAGVNAGTPLAVLQISCVARGRSLFGSSNVDLENVKKLVGGGPEDVDAAAVGGFFANGEMGPVGIAGVGLDSKMTHMHGFTTVAAAICEFSSISASSSPTLRVESGEDNGDSAWG